VNLGLRVRETRPDGYHEVDTVLQSVDLHDTLELSPCPDPGGGIALKVRVEDSGGLDIPPEENLAVRAAELLRERVGLPRGQGVTIELRKRIPVGAGLGGGSSDAAAVLAGLNALFALGLSRKELVELGAALGSDVPFFLWGGRGRARGRGAPATSIRRSTSFGPGRPTRPTPTTWRGPRWRCGPSSAAIGNFWPDGMCRSG